MAHKTGGSTTRTNKDSISKRLGVKKYGGEAVSVGQIIIRQKGSKFYAGKNTKFGNDYTIYSLISGKVSFTKKLGRKVVNVIS